MAQARDSGYGASPTHEDQPDPYHAHTPRSTATNTMYTPGVPVTEASYDLPSPVSAELEFGPDYARKDRLNYPPSEVSLHTYLVRAQHFVRHVKRLPWVAKERVTKDYVPALVQKEREDEVLRPAFVWVNNNYYLAQPERTSGVQSSKYPSGVTVGGNDPMRASGSTVWDTSLPLSMPQRMSYAKLDLDDEFSGKLPRCTYSCIEEPFQHRSLRQSPYQNTRLNHSKFSKASLQQADHSSFTDAPDQHRRLSSPRLHNNG